MHQSHRFGHTDLLRVIGVLVGVFTALVSATIRQLKRSQSLTLAAKQVNGGPPGELVGNFAHVFVTSVVCQNKWPQLKERGILQSPQGFRLRRQ